jgi:hypothetical protein
VRGRRHVHYAADFRDGHFAASHYKHLGVLAAAGLVRDVKIGRERLWEFEPTQLDEARRSLELIGRQWDHALAKLKLAVESSPI